MSPTLNVIVFLVSTNSLQGLIYLLVYWQPHRQVPVSLAQHPPHAVIQYIACKTMLSKYVLASVWNLGPMIRT